LAWSFSDRGIEKGVIIVVGKDSDTLRGRAMTYGDALAIPGLPPRRATASLVPVSCKNVDLVEPVVDSEPPWLEDLNRDNPGRIATFGPDPLVGRCFRPMVGNRFGVTSDNPELQMLLGSELVPPVIRLDGGVDSLSADPLDRRVTPDVSTTRVEKWRSSWQRWTDPSHGQDSIRLVWRLSLWGPGLIVAASGDTLKGRAFNYGLEIGTPPREVEQAPAMLVPVSCSELKLLEPPPSYPGNAGRRDTTTR
jgi:hypothetical protein